MMMDTRSSVLILMTVIGVALCASTSTTKSSPSTTQKPPTSGVPGTTVNTAESCKNAEFQGKDKCSDCLRHSAKCMWCGDESADKSEAGLKCVPYPVGNVLPIHKCKGGLDHARWGVCWVNFKVLLIVMGCLAGVILISLSCCIYCCCCRSGGNKKKYQQEEAKYERQKEERQIKSDERKAERKAKHDDIRRKYGIGFKGLVKEDNPYQRFDA